MWQGKRRHPLLNGSPHFRIIYEPGHVGHFYEFVRQATRHCGRYPVRLVGPDPVVPDGIQGNNVHVVFDLFRTARREPGKTARLHPHIKVVPFDVRRAHMGRIGSALNRRLANAGAFGWLYRPLALFRRRTEQLYELGIIDIAAKYPFNGLADHVGWPLFAFWSSRHVVFVVLSAKMRNQLQLVDTKRGGPR